MSAPLIPVQDPNNPNPSLPAKEATTQETVKATEDLSIRDELKALDFQAQRELMADNQRQLARANAAEQALDEYKNKSREPSAVDFLTDPRKIIEEAINKAVAPINEEVNLLRRERNYNALVAQVQREAPQIYRIYLDNQAFVDQVMRSAPELTPQVFVGQVLMANGARAAGLGGSTNSELPTPKKEEPPVTKDTPPYIPPSPPPAPKRDDEVKEEDVKLTAAQEVMSGRIPGLSRKGYLALLNSDDNVESFDAIIKAEVK